MVCRHRPGLSVATTLRIAAALALLAVSYPSLSAQARSNPPATNNTASPPPANDNFANAISIGALPYTSPGEDTSGATTEPGEPLSCGSSPMTATVWFAYTAAATVQVNANTVGSNYDTVLAVYTGSALGSLHQVACNDDTPGLGTQSSVTFTVQAGTTYYFQIGGYLNSGGAYGKGTLVFSANLTSAPANDNFAGATSITGLPYTSPMENNGAASIEPGEPLTCGSAPMTATVWFQYVPATTTLTTITTGGSYAPSGNRAYDTVLALYTGTGLSNLRQVACNNNAPGLNLLSAVKYTLRSGATYYIQVGSYDLGNGDFVSGNLFLNVNATPAITPVIGVSPSSGQYNQTLTVTGTGYLPNEPVNIYMGPFSSWDALVYTKADSTGSFTRSFSVPSAKYGPDTITAVGQASTKMASTTFTINPQVSLNKLTVVAGSSATMKGYGFGSLETVQAHWATPNGPLLGSTTSRYHGSFDGSAAITFTVPMSPAGAYNVYGVGLSTGATATVGLTISH